MDSGTLASRVVALNGDSWSTPAGTLEAMWAANGSGASGLLLACHVTQDNHIVCTPDESVVLESGDEVPVRSLTLTELQKIDAGLQFRSTVLDDDGQATGERGDDYPWRALEQEWPLKTRAAVHYQTLDYILQHFARRTAVTLLLPANVAEDTPLLDVLISMITRMSLQQRVILLAETDVLIRLHDALPMARLNLDASSVSEIDTELLSNAKEIGAEAITVEIDSLSSMSDADRAAILDAAAKEGIQWWLVARAMPYAPTSVAVNFMRSIDAHVHAYITHAVLPTLQALEPAGIVFEEDFAGSTINEQQWRAGYSSLYIKSGSKLGYPDCTIQQNDGLIITLIEGQRYSGGAAVTVVPLHGDFDAIVDFHIEAPNQATTFELAAIGIDPGYHHISNDDLNSRNVNLSFDVHGAPPYASSERDQNDGFRCGWNNSYNLTQVAPDWEARSVNMYNKYTRDVGDGSPENPDGSLRLVRCGPVFCGYYKDGHNSAWVGSGSMLVQSMPSDCFIRLALKHWDKHGKPPPANQVIFRNFSVRQR